MRKLAIIAASLSLALSGCTLTTGQQLVVAAAYTSGACVLTNIATGAAVTATEMNLPAGADPAASKTLQRWKTGQALSSTQCMQLAQALQTAGQQVMAAEAASTSTK